MKLTTHLHLLPRLGMCGAILEPKFPTCFMPCTGGGGITCNGIYYACMHVCIYVRMYVCMHKYVLCMYVCMHKYILCMYVCIYVCTSTYCVCMCAQARIMCVCMYVCQVFARAAIKLTYILPTTTALTKPAIRSYLLVISFNVMVL